MTQGKSLGQLLRFLRVSSAGNLSSLA